MGILDDYIKQAAIDKNEQNSDFPTEDGSCCGTNCHDDEEYRKKYEQELERLRNDPNDIGVAYRKFQEEFVKITEDEIDTKYADCIEYVTPKLVVKKFKCPKCGKEIISKSPVMYNPFNLEKIAKHECECGFKCNLDYAYPRMILTDDNGEEIVAYPR